MLWFRWVWPTRSVALFWAPDVITSNEVLSMVSCQTADLPDSVIREDCIRLIPGEVRRDRKSGQYGTREGFLGVRGVSCRAQHKHFRLHCHLTILYSLFSVSLWTPWWWDDTNPSTLLINFCEKDPVAGVIVSRSGSRVKLINITGAWKRVQSRFSPVAIRHINYVDWQHL